MAKFASRRFYHFPEERTCSHTPEERTSSDLMARQETDVSSASLNRISELKLVDSFVGASADADMMRGMEARNVKQWFRRFWRFRRLTPLIAYVVLIFIGVYFFGEYLTEIGIHDFFTRRAIILPFVAAAIIIYRLVEMIFDEEPPSESPPTTKSRFTDEED